MNSVRKITENFKSKLRSVPRSIVLTVIICLVGVAAFSLGWVARGAADDYRIQQATLQLPTASGASRSGGQGSGVGVFVASQNADHFHYRWCPGAKRIHAENKVYFESKTAAQDAGYEPAGNCPGLQGN